MSELKTLLEQLNLQLNGLDIFSYLDPSKVTQDQKNTIFDDFQKSTKHLRELEELHAQSDDKTLESALRDFFMARWAIIRESPAAYIEFPNSPLNLACQQLARLISKKWTENDENGEAVERLEPIAQILMPTIKVRYYVVSEGMVYLADLTENADRSLATDQFIVNSSGEAIIPLKEWYSRCDAPNKKHYAHQLYWKNPKGEFYEPTLMTQEGFNFYSFQPAELPEEDFKLLASAVLPHSQTYFEQIQLEIKNAGLPDKENAFDVGLQKLIQDLMDCGDSGKYKRDPAKYGPAAQESGLPHPRVNALAQSFFTQYWDPLPQSKKDEFFALSVENNLYYTLGYNLIKLKYNTCKHTAQEAKIYVEQKLESMHPCVEEMARRLSSILNTHRSKFECAKQKTTPHEPTLKAIDNQLESPTQTFNGTRYADKHDDFVEKLNVYPHLLDALKTNQVQDYLQLMICFTYLPAQRFDLIARNSTIYLLQAFEEESFGLICALIRNGADLKQTFTTDKRTPLHQAVSNNWDEVVDACLASPTVNLNQKDAKGQTALALCHDQRISARLIDAGANLSKEYNQVDYVFEALALKNNYHDLLLSLVKRGVSVTEFHELSKQQTTNIFNYAIEHNLVDLFDACLARIGDGILVKNHEGKNALHFAAIFGRRDFLANIFRKFKKMVFINDKDKTQATPLHSAIAAQHPDCAVFLLEQGADPSGTFGKPPMSLLACAVRHQYSDLLCVLLKQQYPVDFNEEMQVLKPYKSGRLIDLAIEFEWTTVVEACLKHPNFKVNDAGSKLRPPLHLAAFLGRTAILSTLCQDPNIEVNTPDKCSQTALQYATLALKPDVNCIIQLIRAGANFAGTFGPKNESLIDWSISNLHLRLLKEIIQLKGLALPLVKDLHLIHTAYIKYSYLNLDVEADRTQQGEWNEVILACLARPDLDVQLKDKKDRPLLWYAMQAKRLDHAQILISKGARLSEVVPPVGMSLVTWMINRELTELAKLRLKEESPNFSDLMKRPDLNQLYKELGHRDLCQLYGINKLDSSEAFKLYAQANLGVQPSTYLKQGLTVTDNTLSNKLIFLACHDRFKTQPELINEMPQGLKRRYFPNGVV